MTTRYAAIDTGNLTGAVYGVGETVEAAERDALEYSGGGDADAVYDIVEITGAAYAYVKEHGGAPSPRVRVSHRGVEMQDEEV